MSRSHQSSSSSSSATKFGGGALLRTKHIDTLEVLEEYSKDIERLQKENKALQQQVTKLSGLNGDPLARIHQLETILAVERDSNQEMSQRIKLLGSEAERMRTESTNRDIQHRTAYSELEKRHRELEQQHSTCQHQHASLKGELDSVNGRMASKADEMAKECRRMKEIIDSQTDRLRTLEANLVAASATPPEDVAHQQKLQKLKDRLGEREAQVAKLLSDLAKSRDSNEELQLARQGFEEKYRQSQNDLLALQQQQQQNTSRKSASDDKLRRDHKKEKEEWSKREKSLVQTNETLQQEIERLKSIAASSSSSADADSADRARTIDAQQTRISELEKELGSIRTDYHHLQQTFAHLKSEHTKVASALNRTLSSGASNTITIASKRGMFPEVMQLKREKEALEKQVAELQGVIQVLHVRLAQNQIGGQYIQQQTALTSSATSGLSNIQQLQRVGSRSQVTTVSSTAPSSMSSSPSSSPLSSPIASSPDLSSTGRRIMQTHKEQQQRVTTSQHQQQLQSQQSTSTNNIRRSSIGSSFNPLRQPVSSMSSSSNSLSIGAKRIVRSSS